MAAANPLPKKLRTRLAELGHRLHRMHVIQGLCRIVLVLVCAAFLAVLLDAAFRFPGWLRGLLLAGWLVLGFFEVRRFIRGPLAEPLDAEGLAAAVEQEFPRLGERLTTAVELAGTDDPANGSPDLVDIVIKDAETRTRKLDLNRAAPAATTLAFAIASVIAIVAILVPLVAVPKAGEHARRFFAPWYSPKTEVPYAIKVTSGDPTVKRGETTTLSALIEPTKAGATLPSSATAVIKTDRGTERVLMHFDPEKREAFLPRGPLESGFQYRVVSGDAESEWHTVTVVDPVRLENSRVTATPPAYALEAGDKAVTTEGLSELHVMQHSRITFDLKFNRLPSAAWLEWKPQNEDAAAIDPARRISLIVGEDATATLSVFALAAGEFRLYAEADKVRTPFPEQPLRVQLDLPPKFEKVTGVAGKTLALRPGEKLPIDCVVTDDVALGRIEMEYRVDEGKVTVVPLPLKGLGTKRVSGSYALDIADKVKEGQNFQYRLVATDNRNLPEAKLTPQKTYYPENEKWAELKLNAEAAPLREQEIEAKKNEIDDKLKAILEELKAEQRAAYSLKVNTARLPALKPEQSEKLGEIQNAVHGTGNTLDELAREVSLTQDLARLAEAVRDVSDSEVRTADGSLTQAKRDDKAEPRTKNLDRADNALVEAIRKVEALRKENERLAKERLDKHKLDQLAEEQRKLAEQTAKADKEKLQELQQKQKELEEKLKNLAEDSEPLKNALEQLRQQQLEKLSKESQRLEQELRDLTRAMKDLEQKNREKQLADLLKKQQDLAARAQQLADKTDTAARTAPLSPLNKEEIEKAAEALKNGNLNDAVDQQEKAAQELERLAKELEKAVARARDPREAAKQLKRLQEDLRRKVEEATKKTPLRDLPKDRREAFEKQQQAIAKATEKLSIPPDADAERTRREAVEKANQAKEALTKADADKADDRMQKSREALARLAEQMPTQEKRLAQARAEVAKIKQEQDAIAKLAEQAAKQTDKQDPNAAATRQELAKRVADLAKRQAEAADRLSKLDAPGHEERREKTGAAMRQAKADLDKGRPQDIGASQQAARRELERLEQALDGKIPADDQADRLAKKQKELAEQMKKNARQPDAAKQRELQQQQAELSKDLQDLRAPEAASTKDDALQLSRKAESAKSADEAADLADQAARALQKLADQLNDRESEADKADRLAKKQKQAAEEADRLAKKKENSPVARKQAQQRLDEAKNLRAGEDGQKDKQDAVEALTRAQQANGPENLAKAEKDAADALQRLADKMQKQQAQDRPGPRKDDGGKLDGLPNKAQADEARELAEEQRKLRDELARANEDMAKQNQPLDKNPLEDLVKEQQKIAEEAAKLADEVAKQGDKPEAKQQARQAADAAKQAGGQLQNGRVEPAKEAGQQAAQKLEQLAQGDPKGGPGKQAKELAGRQEEVNKKLEEMAGNTRAARAQQADRQKDLQQQIQQLRQRMERASQEMNRPGNKAEQAAGKAQQADDEMKNAREQNQKGERGMARESQDKAADALKQAGEGLKEAAQQMAKKEPMQGGRPDQQTGESVQEARDRMNQAQGQLSQGKPTGAGQAMQQAADALKQAAQQMGKPGNQSAGNNPPQPGAPNQSSKQPGANDGSARGQIDLSNLGPLGEKYKGKSWGELPGEIKNQLISDMKARYGEDYARYIKLYFEQLAERK